MVALMNSPTTHDILHLALCNLLEYLQHVWRNKLLHLLSKHGVIVALNQLHGRAYAHFVDFLLHLGYFLLIHFQDVRLCYCVDVLHGLVPDWVEVQVAFSHVAV